MQQGKVWNTTVHALIDPETETNSKLCRISLSVKNSLNKNRRPDSSSCSLILLLLGITFMAVKTNVKMSEAEYLICLE